MDRNRFGPSWHREAVAVARAAYGSDTRLHFGGVLCPGATGDQ